VVSFGHDHFKLGEDCLRLASAAGATSDDVADYYHQRAQAHFLAAAAAAQIHTAGYAASQAQFGGQR
jgi:hypothetical protein